MTRDERRLADIVSLFRQGRRWDAYVATQSLLADAPGLGDSWEFPVQYFSALGDDDAALAAIDHWVSAAPSDPRRWDVKVETLTRAGKIDAALSAAETFLDIDGGAARAHLHLGVLRAQLGERARANVSLRAALNVDPDLTAAWDFISMLKTFSEADSDLNTLFDETERLRAAPIAMRAPVEHALGKAHDDLADYETAFSKWADLGLAMRDEAPYDMSTKLREFADLAGLFSQDYFERTDVPSCLDETPAFIIGAPRTGSTLLERMLSTHDAVRTSGENGLLPLAFSRFGGRTAHDIRAAYGENRNAFADAGRFYVDKLRARVGPAKRILDKTLANYRYVGLVRAALPNAKFIWCRRQSRDVAWSCFKTRLHGHRWKETAADAALYVAAHDRLMRHWADMLGDALLIVDYEALVGSPGDVMQRAFDHIDVGHDDAWRNFHKSTSATATASLAQVRKPLNRNSIGAWRNYKQWVGSAFADLAAE